MNTPKLPNDEEQCRICQSCEAGQLLIFGVSGVERAIPEKIHECLPIKVSEKDGLPPTVCNQCVVKLEEFYRFRKLALETAQTLQDMIPEKSDSDASFSSKMSLSDEKTKEKKPLVIDLGTSGMCSNSGSRTGSVSGKVKSSYPPLAAPHPEDYVLMKEETISVDNSSKNFNVMADYLIEFNNNNRVKMELEDTDIVNAMRKRGEVLAPMWDVFERVQSDQERQSTDKTQAKGSKQALRNVLKGKFSVIHRRYIIAKGAFPCSLCGRCFRFNQGIQREGMTDCDLDLEDEEESAPGSPSTVHSLVTSQAKQVEQHEVIVTFKNHVCTTCNKTFSRNEHLIRHMQIHTGIKQFSCDICQKIFSRKEHLHRHRLTHNRNQPLSQTPPPSLDVTSESDNLIEDKPYPCDICHTVFMRREQLMKHRKQVHGLDAEAENGPKPFTCGTCFKGFTRKEHLTRHRKLHVAAGVSALGLSTMKAVSQVKPLSISKDTVTLEISAGTENNTDGLMSSILQKGKYGEVSIERRPADVSAPAASVNNDNNFDIDSSAYYPTDGLTEEQRAQLEGFLGASTNFVADAVSGNEGTAGEAGTEDYYEDKDCINLEDLKRMPKCRICSKAFTKKSHLQRHLKRYHNLTKEQIASGKFEMYGENGLSSSNASIGQESTATADEDLSMVGGEFYDDDGCPVLKKPRCNWSCNICRKTFTRKYHMYRHQKTQHGIEFPTREQQKGEVKCQGCSAMFPSNEDLAAHDCPGAEDVHSGGEIGSVSLQSANAAATSGESRRKPFKCAICKSAFDSHEGFKDHECKKKSN